MSTQIQNQFDPETIKKICKGAFIAGGGATVVYLLQAISTMNFGQWTAIITAIASILLNAIYQYQRGN